MFLLASPPADALLPHSLGFEPHSLRGLHYAVCSRGSNTLAFEPHNFRGLHYAVCSRASNNLAFEPHNFGGLHYAVRSRDTYSLVFVRNAHGETTGTRIVYMRPTHKGDEAQLALAYVPLHMSMDVFLRFLPKFVES